MPKLLCRCSLPHEQADATDAISAGVTLLLESPPLLDTSVPVELEPPPPPHAHKRRTIKGI